MPNFGESAFIFLLALLLFGPKKLPVLARQLGKMMGDFRRASNEFRSQMEDELRVSEQAERQKEVAAIEAAAPPKAAEVIPEPEHPHMPHPGSLDPPVVAEAEAATVPLPIATSGELNLMPPATGLPVGGRTTPSPFLEAMPIPSIAPPVHTDEVAHEAVLETETLHG